MSVLTDKAGNRYQHEMAYMFSNVNGLKVFRTLQAIHTEQTSQFIDSAGKCWPMCEVITQAGTIEKPQAQLVDGQFYMIKPHGDVIAARYHKGSDEFKVDGGACYPAVLHEIINFLG